VVNYNVWDGGDGAMIPSKPMSNRVEAMWKQFQSTWKPVEPLRKQVERIRIKLGANLPGSYQ
jgi:hypothetical protein